MHGGTPGHMTGALAQWLPWELGQPQPLLLCVCVGGAACGSFRLWAAIRAAAWEHR